MAVLIALKLENRGEVVAEALGDLSGATRGLPFTVLRPVLLRRKGGFLRAEPWADAADPEQPFVIKHSLIRSVHTPRRDAVTAYRRFWEKRSARTGANPLPAVAMEEICTFDEPIVVREPVYRPGNVSAVELVFLVQLVRATGPEACFEIGTFDGRTTLNIAANTGPDCRIFTLDLPSDQIDETEFEIERNERKFIKKQRSGSRFVDTPFAERIAQLYGDSATFDFSDHFGTIDFVFVDASHAREYVLKDAETAMRLLRPGAGGRPKGTVLFHDYGEWEGVTGALEELRVGDDRYAGLVHVRDTTFACLRLE